MSKEFVPSVEQMDFYNWVEYGVGSALVEAVAGSGKTTTLIHGLKLMLKYGKVFMGAYNKKISEEIKAKAGRRDGLFISTFHSAGFSVWRKMYPNVEVDKNKCQGIYVKMAEQVGDAATVEFGGEEAGLAAKQNMMKLMEQTVSLVSYAKQAAFGIIKRVEDKAAWLALIDHFNLDCLGEEEYVIAKAQEVYRTSSRQCSLKLDFDDMILAPLIHNARFWQYDWVLVDEAQDTNAARRLMALKMLKAKGRLVGVGDKHQAIYGFTGADADSLDLLAKATGAKRLPLSVSYRCPISVVEYVRQWVKHIQPHPDAVQGVVKHSTEELVRKEIKPGDAVLCRFNAPLVKMVYSFIADGIPAKIEGREIGNNLKQLATRWKVKTFDQYLDKLQEYQDKETLKFKEKEDEVRIEGLEDRVTCIRIIVNRAMIHQKGFSNPVDALVAEIDSIFQDDVNGSYIVLCSIHKSKGREWHNVYWLQTGANHRAVKAWELEQEINLNYVAGTRAMYMLCLFEPAEKKQR